MNNDPASHDPLDNPPRLRLNWRRVMLRIAIIVSCWYTFVGLFIPNIGSASPMLPRLAWEVLRAHAQDVCERKREFGQTIDSPFLQQVTQRRPPYWNCYWVRTLSRDDGTPVAVIAFPDRLRIPQAGLLFRLLFLDKRKLHYSSYLLTSEGAIWRGSDRTFEPERLPSVDMVGMLETSMEWKKEHTFPMKEPCDAQ